MRYYKRRICETGYYLHIHFVLMLELLDIRKQANIKCIGHVFLFIYIILGTLCHYIDVSRNENLDAKAKIISPVGIIDPTP